jgi:hypothetical protein
MSEKTYSPDSWQHALSSFQSLGNVLNSHRCEQLTIIFSCGHRMDNVAGCQLCKNASLHGIGNPCRSFRKEILYPQEWCPDCMHERQQQARREEEEAKRYSRRMEMGRR